MNPKLQGVSAVVCTMNSISSIEQCLLGLKASGVGEIIVVDAHSTDGTREVADRLASVVLSDSGDGLGAARNLGIEQSTGRFVLNVGSDNVMTEVALKEMLQTLVENNLQGVSALTVVDGHDYLARSMNAWWSTRFHAGPAKVIGTPSLFDGDLLRAQPFDTTRQHSDDSELCERWAVKFGAKFAISDARVAEVGKNSWHEISLRCKNYGFSDSEVFAAGTKSGWTIKRKFKSLAHPARVDLIEPLSRLPFNQALSAAPFLAAFTTLRYSSWIRNARRGSHG